MFQLTKKIVLSALLGGLIFFNVNAQDDVIISGGNSVSSMVTANGKVYVWGSNQLSIGNSTFTGVLGLGSSVNQTIIATPTLVTFPGNVSIKQVNSGSGAHFLALDCEGGLWSWGNNQFGQVGIGTSGNVVNTPTRVKLGVLASEASKFDPAATGFITKGIKTVYAASNNSYAKLEDGRLIAWGANDASSYFGSNGQLGDGTQISKSVPVFVKTPNAPLTGVISVASSDGVTFALVDEDGDGSGTVYSWGNGNDGTLGRNALGTGNPSSNNLVQDSFARPVWYSNTSMMDNVIKISAGDVFGMALDMNGYVWTWGNGGWNNTTGNGTNLAGSKPSRVIAGNTIGASNDGNYLIAKSISGGQGFGMAVTIDGKPVAWGGSDCPIGGLTGTGTTKSGIVPSYILIGVGITHSDVINIFRGDTWGYYQRMDGSIYVWGCNNNGQLGIGNTTNQIYAVKMTPPTNTEFRDPTPALKITPYNLTTCSSKIATSPIVLDNGFTVGTALASLYKVRWFKDGVEVANSPFNVITGKTYTATSIGLYKVTVEYTGSNGTCGGYPIAEAATSISAFTKSFTTYSDLTYCNVFSSLSVNTSNTNKPIYQWYATSSSTTPIAKTVGNNSVIVDLSSLPMVGTDKMVYVEETSQASGILLKKTQACDTSWSNFDVLSTNSSSVMNQSGITTYDKSITINSLSINLRSEIFTPNSTYASTLNFGIYGARISNGTIVADENNLLYSFAYNFSKTNASNSTLYTNEIVKVPVNFTLPIAGTYFISFKRIALTNINGSGLLKIGKGQCTQTLPINAVPAIISYTTNSADFQFSNQASQGQFFNIEFSTGQGFCDRIPVLVKRKCPCVKPSAVSLKDASLLGQKTISVCTGTGTLATIKGTVTTNAPAFNGYYYSIYKKGSTPVYTAGTTVTSKALTASDAGTWILRAEDGTFMDANCYLEDSVKYEVLPSTNIFCKATGIEADEQKNGIRISPSPFKDQFVLETLGMDKVIVIDQRGVLIEERSISNIQNIQMGQNWSSGLYFLQIIGNGISKTTKVIKEQ